MSHDTYLPDEIVLEIVIYVSNWKTVERQTTLARCCAVNWQWYDIAVEPLYAEPYLSGRAYELFVRTICPSVLAHIKPIALSNLVQTLDLSHIVHQGSKSTTARLINRTKTSLTSFVAPQASFAINCWASLSKCHRLHHLDLSLVSEQIDFQALNQTLRQLPLLQSLCLPRCSANYSLSTGALNVRWPPHLTHLALSGSISGKFLWDLQRQPETFPPGFHSLSILHSPALQHQAINVLLSSLASRITVLELRDLPAIRQGRFNSILDLCPHIDTLTIALDYIDMRFAHLPASFSPRDWTLSKPLTTLTLVSSGRPGNPDTSFMPDDLYTLIEERYLGCLRSVRVAHTAGWFDGEAGDEQLDGLTRVLWELDAETWAARRWHYHGMAALWGVPASMDYATFQETDLGRKMRPSFRIVDEARR